jgi:hypothetical protein
MSADLAAHVRVHRTGERPTRLARDEAKSQVVHMFASLTFPRTFPRTSPRGRIAALLLTSQLALGCPADDADDDAADSGAESTGDDSSSGGADESAGATLEIAGDWVDDFGGAHTISDAQWVQTFGADVFTYAIDHFDNDADVVIAQSADDDTWSRFDWSFADDGKLYFCQTAFGLASAAAAEATVAADAADPATAGCGGFAWSALTPA